MNDLADDYYGIPNVLRGKAPMRKPIKALENDFVVYCIFIFVINLSFCPILLFCFLFSVLFWPVAVSVCIADWRDCLLHC